MAGAVDERQGYESQLDDDLEHGLRQTVESQDLLQLLRRRALLTQQTIATATGASLRSVRNWERDGVHLRQQSDDRLRYLAEVVAVLSGTLTPRGIGQWLHARNRNLGGARPIELVADDSDELVLNTAIDLAEGGVG